MATTVKEPLTNEIRLISPINQSHAHFHQVSER